MGIHDRCNAMDRGARRRVVDLNRARILDNDPLKWMSPATRERDDEDLFPRGDTRGVILSKQASGDRNGRVSPLPSPLSDSVLPVSL